MKKNAMLKIAAILMVAVLLTTCAISSTFAKYVTPGKTVSSNIGRVAAWGVEINGEANNDVKLFTDNYGDAIALEGATNKYILAPGTANTTPMTLGIKGQPEVKYQIDVTANLALEGWEINSKYYCPVVITVKDGKGTSNALNGLNYKNAGEFEAAVENAIAAAILGGTPSGTENKYTQVYAAGTAIADTAEEVTVSWAWAFENNVGTVEIDGAVVKQDNVKDTALGDAGVGEAGATIQLTFSIAAQQVNN